MDKIWVKDVKEGERPKSVFLVAKKAVQTAKSGKTYLAATFQDKTGELEARAFERVEELSALFEEKDLVEVEGTIGTFQGKPQLRIETIAKVADPAGLDPAEFIWAAPPEPKKPEKPAPAERDDAVWKELLALVEPIVDPHVKALVQSFVEDEDIAARLRRWPAAKSVHHAYPGGLLEHTVSCLKLAHRLSDQYPQVDRDLLVAGAFFHDLGKIRELGSERSPEYTDEGRLVGHHVMTAQWIHDRARRLGVPRELEHQLVHLVLAHHGKLEYGSPKVPMTLEALLTHEIDEIDSRVNSWLNLMGKEGGSRRWTSSDNVYEQPIWRGALPTVQAEKKGPAPEVLSPVIYVPHGGGGGGGGAGGGQNAQKRKDPRPPKPRREPKPRPEAGEKAAAPAGEPGAAVEAKPEGAPAEARPERRPHSDRPHGGPPDRGGPRGPGGFGDKKRGYQGPRLPGDKGPHRPPEKPKNLTHNPFAALAAKLEDPSKATEAPAPAPEPAAVEPPAPEAPAAEAAPEEKA